jgi:hypothetical protein
MEEYHSSEEVETALRQLFLKFNIDIYEIKTYNDFCEIVDTHKIKLIHYLMNIGYWTILEKSSWLNIRADAMCETIKRIFPNIHDATVQNESWIRRLCLDMCMEAFFIKNKKGVALWEIMLKRRFVHPWIFRKTYAILFFAYGFSLYLPVIWVRESNLWIIGAIPPLFVFYFIDKKYNWTIVINLFHIGIIHILSVLSPYITGFAYGLISNLVYWSIISFVLSILVQITMILTNEYDLITKNLSEWEK